MRAAIADLETVVDGELSEDWITGGRNMRRPIEQTLKRLFITTDSASARQVLNDADSDQDELLLWIEENMHLHLIDSTELADAYEALSLADQILGRIMRQQNWKLLSYFYDYIAMTLIPSRTKTPFRDVKYKRPSWPLIVWRGTREQDKRGPLLSKLSDLAVVSRYRADRTHGRYIRQIIEQDPKQLLSFANWLSVRPEIVFPQSQKRAR